MNKMIKGLLVTVLAVSSAPVINAHTDRTFLMPRPTGVDLPMEYTTFESLIDRKAEDKFGGNFQVTAFYRDSGDSGELAKYFLMHNKSTIALTQATTVDNDPSTAVDVDLRYLIHDPLADNAISANLSLKPEVDSYGVRIDYHQDLDKILKGLYLKASLPIACVEIDPKLKISSTSLYSDGELVETLATSYFNGNYIDATVPFAQSALTNAKITGKHDETGVADIDIALGYKFLNKHAYYTSLAIGLTIPTGNNAKGINMFEPIVGNGQHFGLGVDVDAQARVWGDYEHNLKINLFMKYRYLFESNENRTLRIEDRPFSQYFLLGVSGQVPATPAANVLTQHVNVTPGSQFDGILGLAYNNGGFAFDLGYNMYFRESEKVHYKGGFSSSLYNVMAKNWNQSAAFDPTNVSNNDVDQAAADVTTTPLNISNLDLDAPATPSQFTSGIYSGLGYYFKDWEIPLMLGLGGKYEFASTNAAIEQWTAYCKIGVSF